MSAATTLPEYEVADEGLLSLPRDELEHMQGERLRGMVAYVWDRSPFWRERFTEHGVEPGDVRGIEDLHRLPFTRRADLNAAQAEHPPFGRYECSPRETWNGVYTTSGTTGRKLKRCTSRRDWRLMLERFERHPGPEPGDIYMLLGPVDGLLGPTIAVEAFRRMGAVPVLAGLWDTRTKVRMIAELRPAMIAGVASYIVHLTEVAAELGIDLADCGIKGLHSFGEPGAAVAATKATMNERFGDPMIVDGYGLSEVWPLGGNCAYSDALEIAEDFAAVECVDPDTGEPVPEGQPGEIVFTNLIGDTHPLLRYRSGDIGRLVRSEPCACGTTFVRIERIEGRADDMLWYRGVNFFPSAVEEIVRRRPELSPEYRIVVDSGDRGLARLSVQVEAVAGERAAVGEALRSDLRGGLGVAPEVEVLPAGALPRGEGGKVKRVLYEREERG